MVALSISVDGEKSKVRILKKLQEKMIKYFLDVIVLAELQNRQVSGYDLISFIHEKFGFLASSGTVYSLLYSLERHGLVEGVWFERKRVYKLTAKGLENIQVILDLQDKIKGFMVTILTKAKGEAS